jgi:hypothetical protein
VETVETSEHVERGAVDTRRQFEVQITPRKPSPKSPSST